MPMMDFEQECNSVYKRKHIYPYGHPRGGVGVGGGGALYMTSYAPVSTKKASKWCT